MSTTLLSAMTVSLLTAACLTALADPSKQQNRTSTAGEPSAYQASTTSAPVADADDDSGYIQAVGRNGSHSMHPNAPVTAEQFADDEGKVLRQTESE